MSQTIITVDDSASIRQMIHFTLKSAGFNVIEASDGEEGLKRISEYQADMIITDLNMPKLDGIGLIRATRQMEHYKFVPIIMLSTESQTHKKQEGRQAGATGWIVKPFNPEQLLAVVKKVLR